MGSYYSVLSNEANSNGQYHFYFYVSDQQMINWFRLLHGPTPVSELEVNHFIYTQTHTIHKIKNRNI